MIQRVMSSPALILWLDPVALNSAARGARVQPEPWWRGIASGAPDIVIALTGEGVLIRRERRKTRDFSCKIHVRKHLAKPNAKT